MAAVAAAAPPGREVKGSRRRQDPDPRPEAALVRYGGDFTWVGAPYKMQVKPGLSPLQWLNGLTKRLLVLDDIVLTIDGGFRRPSETSPMFPQRGIDLRWRWDEVSRRIVIHFWSDGRHLDWRWDELRPSEELRFPSTVPDLIGTGHVGSFTFEYSLLSAAAEQPRAATCAALAAAPLQPHSDARGGEVGKLWLPGLLAKEPRGSFEAGGKPTDEQEACRDLARVLLTGGPPRVFLLCPGLSEPLALGQDLNVGPGDGSPGSLGPEAIASVLSQFSLELSGAVAEACLSAGLPLPLLEGGLAERIALHASTGVSLDFATSHELLPLFLQPLYVVVCLDKPLGFRLLTYGFVAEGPSEVAGSRPDQKFTPTVVRLLSPELDLESKVGSDSQKKTFRYVAWATQESCTADCLAHDSALLLEAVQRAQWSALF